MRNRGNVISRGSTPSGLSLDVAYKFVMSGREWVGTICLRPLDISRNFLKSVE